ncbi:unnamed protein product [Lactuca saligna]|uniref:Uncharacterized protein n=1 Tax=Lactuca saligna TaxID=75948 RepID=A0AA35ZKZ9_LACSI|nr:unnamed protein product [Lactuca saligna]
MDIYHTTVNEFSALGQIYEWWNITSVRVLYVWEDMENNRMLLWMIDRQREKILAIIPRHLVPGYRNMNLKGNVFSVQHFQVDEYYLDNPMYQQYKICTSDKAIMINHATTFTRLASDFASGYPLYPIVSTVTTVAQDHTNKRRLVDVVGRIVWGNRIRQLRSFELILQDETGNVTKLLLYNVPANLMIKVIVATYNKSILYVSCMKLVHNNLGNLLVSTVLTDFDVEPQMYEADRIRARY